jgi:hypothetical protein
MFAESEYTLELECPVCYAAHDEEIHEATLRLHRWYHHHVTHRLEPDDCATQQQILAAQVA